MSETSVDSFDDIVGALPATKIRNSYRYQVHAEGVELMLDYVFADNPDEAVVKAHDLLEIPADVVVTVRRIPDLAVVPARLN